MIAPDEISIYTKSNVPSQTKVGGGDYPFHLSKATSLFELRGGGWQEGRGGELKCYIHMYIHTYRQTYRQTYRASDDAGPRGAFASKNLTKNIF